MGKEKGPLEMIARVLGLEYLSDLRNPVYYPAVKCALSFIDEERFSAEDWSEAASYITGKKQSYATAKEAVAGILGEEKREEEERGSIIKNYVWNKYMETRMEV